MEHQDVVSPKKIKTAFTDTDMHKKSTFQKLNWMHIYLLAAFPVFTAIGLFYVPVTLTTFIWAVVMYHWTGWGITAGYHRLWSHKSYDATLPVRLFLAFFGAGAFEGSIKWWCRNHRAHHRYVDTDKDPYNARRGFFYSHLGWMLIKQNPDDIGRVDIRDLSSSKLIAWQHKYYPYVALLAGLVFPAVVASFWGDWKGGLFYGGFGRAVFVHHSTFCVNSLAHWWGEKSYSDEHTSYDSIITALVTLGEGYHNFHHSLPSDYRNGVRWYHYDPTKAFIWVLSLFGLTQNLKRFPENEIQKSRLQMKVKKIEDRLAKLHGPPKDSEIPVYTSEMVKARVAKGEALVIVKGYVHDVNEWREEHPGGPEILASYLGRDATAAFNGGVYNHSRIARNLLDGMRVARHSDKSE
jgi:stearoyl-CoA desaturase (delta-9 desaturase)